MSLCNSSSDFYFSRTLLKVLLMAALTMIVSAQQPQPDSQRPADRPGENKSGESETKQPDSTRRTELNLLGKTDASSGESRRNENVQFNLVDNNALKELNIRLGTTATIVREFAPASNWFGAEFGNPPRAAITIPTALKSGFHGALNETHLNSVTSARSFFQVGSVKPARENEYGFNFGLSPWRNTKLFTDGSQQKVRGNVNGNVLVPRPDERTPLVTDPATRAIVAKFLGAYPAELPNRTDINVRALNTNAPQAINGDQFGMRLDQTLGAGNSLALHYQFTSQKVDAFQFVAGQNPNTGTKSHLARIAWTRQWNAETVTYLSLSYDRLRSRLEPDEQSVGPFVLISGLTGLGPDGSIPINRAQNNIRYAGQMQRVSGSHTFSAGFAIVRRQLNGRETDVHRGFFSFNNDFDRDAITNLRLGVASQHIVSIGNVSRGFRWWELQFYGSDSWRLSPRLTAHYGLRWQPSTAPIEVNDFNRIPYDSDLNNVGPTLGLTYRLPRRYGVARAAWSMQFGEIFPVTFQQIRFSPPNNFKIVIPTPDLINPLGQAPELRPTLYTLAPELATPYSAQYNLSWEPEISKSVRLQLGYVGSRSHKLLVMWYLNRAHAVPGIELTTKTINQRRANQNYADIRVVVNGSRGYFDAARASLILSNWRGLTMDAAYWFSKAMDLGASYTNTANENDSRKSRSQTEFETHRDMKGLSDFDQTHAFLWRASYLIQTSLRQNWLSRISNGWNLSTVALVKTGIPFNLSTGSDGPGFGNVDGNGGDRPNLLDPSILGRTIANPNTSRQLLPRTAFAYIGASEAHGNLGRNVFRKGPIHNLNASLSRTWGIHRDLRLTFRAESINLFNTPQFAEPGFELANQNFGAITNTLNDGRTFRFALQIGW
jgi:hypothetical protein